MAAKFFRWGFKMLNANPEFHPAIQALLSFIFGEVCDRNNRHKIQNFVGFDFEIISAEYETKSQQVEDISVNDLVTISDVLCTNNLGTFDEIVARIISCLCNFNVLRSNIIPDKVALCDDENKNDFNVTANKINDISGASENNFRNGSGNCENNEIQIILIPDYVLKTSMRH